MKHDGFPASGQWFKGNLHSHTIASDGGLRVEQVSKAYQQAGYDFMAITDHGTFCDHRDVCDSHGFLTIPAMEGSLYLVSGDTKHPNLDPETSSSGSITKDLDGRKQCVQCHHFNVYLGTSAMQKKASAPVPVHNEPFLFPVSMGQWDGAALLQEQVNRFRDRGCFLSYNHPQWSLTTAKDIMGVDGLWAVEVYNHMTTLLWGQGEDTITWDALLRSGTQIGAVAVDDNHNHGGESDMFGGYVMVKANALTHDDIVENLLAGNYYSSTGAVIEDVSITNGVVEVRCENAKQIRFAVGGRLADGHVHHSPDGTLTHATYTLKGHETYVRVEIVNQNGKRAWTNPMYL